MYERLGTSFLILWMHMKDYADFQNSCHEATHYSAKQNVVLTPMRDKLLQESGFTPLKLPLYHLDFNSN
jgi:hypothetical protein